MLSLMPTEANAILTLQMRKSPQSVKELRACVLLERAMGTKPSIQPVDL